MQEGDTGESAAGAAGAPGDPGAPEAPKGQGGSAWHRRVSGGSRQGCSRERFTAGVWNPGAHSPVAQRLLPVPGTGHARKGGVGGARLLVLLPRDVLTAPGAGSASTAPGPPSIMQPGAGCGAPVALHPQWPLLAFAGWREFAEDATRAGQVMSSPSPLGEVEPPLAAPHPHPTPTPFHPPQLV